MAEIFSVVLYYFFEICIFLFEFISGLGIKIENYLK